MTEIIEVIPTTVTKQLPDGTTAIIKAEETDAGGTFYVFDVIENGKLISANRYVYKDSLKQPFEALTVDEGCILIPPIELTNIVEEGV